MSDRVTVIGCGNMGGALVRGMAAAASEFVITAIDQRQGLRAAVAGLPGVNVAEALPSDPTAACGDAVILAIKPQDLPRIAAAGGGALARAPLLISILGGVTTADLAETLGRDGPIVRAMPNTPATVGMAATAASAGEGCTAEHRDLCERIFGAVGTLTWLHEEHVDAVTGLSGSGPAYVCMVIEALTDGGVKMGLPRQEALALASQTVLGSAKLVQESGLHPAVLRDQVTTPGGTTISAIHELEAHGLRAMLISAVATATEQARRLRRRAGLSRRRSQAHT